MPARDSAGAGHLNFREMEIHRPASLLPVICRGAEEVKESWYGAINHFDRGGLD